MKRLGRRRQHFTSELIPRTTWYGQAQRSELQSQGPNSQATKEGNEKGCKGERLRRLCCNLQEKSTIKQQVNPYKLRLLTFLFIPSYFYFAFFCFCFRQLTRSQFEQQQQIIRLTLTRRLTMFHPKRRTLDTHQGEPPPKGLWLPPKGAVPQSPQLLRKRLCSFSQSLGSAAQPWQR